MKKALSVAVGLAFVAGMVLMVLSLEVFFLHLAWPGFAGVGVAAVGGWAGAALTVRYAFEWLRWLEGQLLGE